MPHGRPRKPSRLGLPTAVACAAGVALVAWRAPGQVGRAAQDAPPGVETCAGECHQDILNRPFMHGPTQRDCQACHVQGSPTEHRFFLITPKDELCQKCHALPARATVHHPVQAGACMDCHDPHGSAHKGVLIADPNRDLCGRCHGRELTTGKYVHGPVVLGACVVCHEPHTSAEPSLLRVSERDTCLMCHAEVTADRGPDWHTHGALDQGCVGCHDPHASDHRFQLHATAPDLCLKCHEQVVMQGLEAAPVVHGAVMQEGGCVICHEPHGSTLPNLRKQSETEMCLACHDQPMQSSGGQPLANMATVLATNHQHHGPVREGLCTACHQPHAGERFRLLVEEYPPEFYAPFRIETFSLCFRCHIPELVLEPKGSGLTNFRDGDTNLHWLHVNQEKGRTCRACHEVHASSRPAHMRDAVPFGSAGWLLEINFAQSGRGGSCTPGCHTTRTYDRGPGPAPLPPAGSRDGVQP
jgi:predicted CXXCH cytochrome family protein